MFRRRLDLSWPLIIVLVGLFLFSLRLPRQWERIARPASLVLTPRNLAARNVPLETPDACDQAAVAGYRVVNVADHVAADANVADVLRPASTSDDQSAVVVPVVAPQLPAAEFVRTGAPFGKTERPVEAVVVSDVSPETSPPLRDDAASAESASSAGRTADAAPAKTVLTDEVRVLRDVTTAETGPSLGREVDRQPRPVPASGDAAASVQRLPPTSVPEPALAAESSTAESAPNPARAVVPEPQYPVTDVMPSAGPQTEALLSKPDVGQDATQTAGKSASSAAVESAPLQHKCP